ncbi:tRNA (N6-isopentenyl adenosine(37)-C2)-methylthiotransferase MiaB, partial [Desulfovibrio oxamicus]|nr:tRNA (N6-isopentenyl adenosine(37)-C2)-methylthiotransferase MiaB [Nitratidesulfovibrio oxamicus]
MSGHAFFALTLGCKINQYETEAVREAWLARGWREAADPADADVLLINSCAVTARAVAD